MISASCNAADQQSTNRQPVLAQILITISLPPPTIQRGWSVNNLCGGSASDTAMNWIVVFLNWVLRGQSFQYVLGYNFSSRHAMSHRSEYFDCSSRGNITEPAFCSTITSLLAVEWLESPRFPIPTAMSDSQSLNTWMLEIMISSKNEHVFVLGLSHLTFQIVIDAWRALMNLGLKQPIAWNNSRHASSWQFHIHCGNEDISSPGIICILCHQVLRHPSEHGTRRMGNHILAKAHNAQLKKLSALEVTVLNTSMIDETALGIPNSQGSWGIAKVSSQQKLIFDIQIAPYWPKWRTKRSKPAAKDSEISESQQDTWTRYLR